MKRASALADFLSEYECPPETKKPKLQWPVCVLNPAPHHAYRFEDGGAAPEAEAEPKAEAYLDTLSSSYPRKEVGADDITAADYFQTFVARSQTQCAAEALAPQRSDAWKLARKFCLTASDFGSAAGSNPYSSPDDLVKKKLWETFNGNAATRWGTEHEPHAEESFLIWAKANISSDAELFTLNLTKFADMSWLGLSPDGILIYTENGKLCADLVEYKCPTRDQTDCHPYAKYPKCTPPYYRHQMLGIWSLFNTHGGLKLKFRGEDVFVSELGCAWFVVWQPEQLYVVKHDFDLEEWHTDLFPKLRAWYFKQFLPALVWNYNRRLEFGETMPASVPITLENFDNT